MCIDDLQYGAFSIGYLHFSCKLRDGFSHKPPVFLLSHWMRRDPFPIDLIVSNRIAVAGTAIADILHTDPPESTERLAVWRFNLFSFGPIRSALGKRFHEKGILEMYK